MHREPFSFKVFRIRMQFCELLFGLCFCLYKRINLCMIKFLKLFIFFNGLTEASFINKAKLFCNIVNLASLRIKPHNSFNKCCPVAK